MNLSFYIARRYLLGKKSHNIINIISVISALGVMIGTAAMIIVLSVFNGFHDLIESLFSSFNPSIRISAIEGKTCYIDAFKANQIKNIPGVINYIEVLEENALIKYNHKQSIVTVKGVSTNYLKTTGLDSLMIEGSLVLNYKNRDYCVIGAGVAYYLGLDETDLIQPVYLYAPQSQNINLQDPLAAFVIDSIRLAGVFSVQQDIDTKYLLTPISFARKLFNIPTHYSSIEIMVDGESNISTIQQKISEIVGPSFKIQNKQQQEALLFKVMQSEKLIILIILGFILFIAIVNTVGSLSLLILDKQKDIGILKSLGANQTLIKRIFFTEGLLISISGGLLGIIVGWLVCVLQSHYGFVRFPAGTFVVDAYPVHLLLSDVILTFLTVVGIGLLSLWWPVKLISKKFFYTY